MGILLDFQFLAILNVFALLLSAMTTPYVGDRRNALGIIILFITAIVVLGDIFFLVLKATGH